MSTQLTTPAQTLPPIVDIHDEFIKEIYEVIEDPENGLLLKREGSGIRAYYSRTIGFIDSKQRSYDYDGYDSKDFSDDCWVPAPETFEKESEKWRDAIDVAVDLIEGMISDIEFKIEFFFL